MTNQTPKAFDFGEEAVPPPEPAARPVTPKAFDFSDAEVSSRASAPPKVAPKALFESEDHPAIRDALSIVRAQHPSLFAHFEQRLAALFRRILPVKLALVAEWAEEPLMEQAALLQPVTELVRKFSELAVPALLEGALDSARGPTGLVDRLFNRSKSAAQYKPELIAARAKLLQLTSDGEAASRKLDESAKELTLHWVVLAIVTELVGRAPDATLLDVLLQRRTLIQQAVRQAELSMLQMGQMRQQAAELIGQVSSFLTVTLPALEMAQTQRGNS